MGKERDRGRRMNRDGERQRKKDEWGRRERVNCVGGEGDGVCRGRGVEG